MKFKITLLIIVLVLARSCYIDYAAPENYVNAEYRNGRVSLQFQDYNIISLSDFPRVHLDYYSATGEQGQGRFSLNNFDPSRWVEEAHGYTERNQEMGALVQPNLAKKELVFDESVFEKDGIYDFRFNDSELIPYCLKNKTITKKSFFADRTAFFAECYQ